MDLSACVEWQFTEAGEGLPERIRAAAALGLRHAEFHLWRDKDIDGIADALAETGVSLTGFCVDPRRSIVDPGERGEFLAAISETLEAAGKLGSPPLIIASGFRVEGLSDEAHFANAAQVLGQAARLAEAAGTLLVLEPLNTDLFPAMYLVSTTLGLDLVEAVASPNLRLLYDVHHSQVMGEDLRAVLEGRMHLVGHVQVADVPGRNEPGTGSLDWRGIVSDLRAMGYAGPLGLEYFPSRAMPESLAMAREAMGL